MLKTFKDALNKGITPSQRRNLALKQVTEQVIAGKPSYHSGMGATVCTILHALEEAGEGYVLFAKPGQGYQIEAAKAATPDEWKAKLTPPEPDWMDVANTPPPVDVMILLTCDGWPPSRLRGDPPPVKVGYRNDSGGYSIFGASWAPTRWREIPYPERLTVTPR